MLQTHGKFMKYVFYTLHRMTPEQLKINPIKPIIKPHPNQELETDDGESINEEEQWTISTEMSEGNSISDIPTQDNEEKSETSQVHNVLSKIHTK